MFEKAGSANDRIGHYCRGVAIASSSAISVYRPASSTASPVIAAASYFSRSRLGRSYAAADLSTVMSHRKRLCIMRAAAAFLGANSRYGRMRPCFDVGVLHSGQQPLYVESAFGAGGVML